MHQAGARLADSLPVSRHAGVTFLAARRIQARFTAEKRTTLGRTATGFAA
jgi:hypothetical protein